MSNITNTMKKVVIIAAVIIIIPILYWLLAPVFFDKEVLEAIPTSKNQAVMNEITSDVKDGNSENSGDEIADKIIPLPGEQNPDSSVENIVNKDTSIAVDRNLDNSGDKTADSISGFEKSGAFTGLAGHSGQGTVKIIKVDADYYIRFEDDFKVDNAPDMFVHLGRDNQYDKAVGFGKLKGNVGSQNYKIDDPAILETHDEVWVWCRAFSVPMGKAVLN